jgi:urease accessory protein
VQGRALLRAARAAWPHRVLDSLAAGSGLAADPAGSGPAAPFHPVVLGACAWITGGTPGEAALIAATSAITSPASAAIRLLGLDPLVVTGLLARLGPEAAAVAAGAARAADHGPPGDRGAAARWARLPAPASPGLDLLAERHAREEVALFES